MSIFTKFKKAGELSATPVIEEAPAQVVQATQIVIQEPDPAQIEAMVVGRIGQILVEYEATCRDLRSEVDRLQGALDAARSRVKDLELDLKVERLITSTDAASRRQLTAMLSDQISTTNSLMGEMSQAKPPNGSGVTSSNTSNGTTSSNQLSRLLQEQMSINKSLKRELELVKSKSQEVVVVEHEDRPNKLGSQEFRKRYRTARGGKGSPYLYLMRCGPYTKIGVSYSPEVRLKQVGSGMPDVTVLVGAWKIGDGAYEIEGAMHERFKIQRSQGEWFRLSDEHLAEVIGELDGIYA